MILYKCVVDCCSIEIAEPYTNRPKTARLRGFRTTFVCIVSMQLYHDCIPPCGSFIYSFAPIDECPFEALRAATVERVIVERRCRMSLSDVAFATSLSFPEERIPPFTAGVNPTTPNDSPTTLWTDIQRYSELLSQFVYIGYIWRFRLLVPTLVPYRTSVRYRVVWIRSVIPPRKSETSHGGQRTASGTKLAKFPM